MNINERMIKYLEYRGITPTSFEKRMGWGGAYLKKTKNPGYDKLIAFLNEFPKLRMDWLMYERGSMEYSFIEDKTDEMDIPEVLDDGVAAKISTTNGQPYYNVDFQGGFDVIMNDQTINPDYLIDFAPYNKDGVVWCNIIGQSMEPEIKSGSIVAIKPIQDWSEFIAFGEIYAIVTKNEQRMIKRLRKGSSDDSYTMISANRDYEPQEIKKSVITHIYQVLGSMQRLS